MDREMRLDLARSFVRELENGDGSRADEILHQIVRDTESSLFQEIGKLTRELHDTLRNVERDTCLAGIAEHNIPDAKLRLHYVIEKTEAAANKTLSAVEQMVPVADRLTQECGALQEEWNRFLRKQMELGDFKQLSKRISAFLDESATGARFIQTNLTEVLMAQDFQDLTGQVIRKVISLVQEVEDKLVTLVRVTGKGTTGMPQTTASTAKGQGTEAEGPQIGTAAEGTVMANQDEVDDLLSSLGF